VNRTVDSDRYDTVVVIEAGGVSGLEVCKYCGDDRFLQVGIVALNAPNVDTLMCDADSLAGQDA